MLRPAPDSAALRPEAAVNADVCDRSAGRYDAVQRMAGGQKAQASSRFFPDSVCARVRPRRRRRHRLSSFQIVTLDKRGRLIDARHSAQLASVRPLGRTRPRADCSSSVALVALCLAAPCSVLEDTKSSAGTTATVIARPVCLHDLQINAVNRFVRLQRRQSPARAYVWRTPPTTTPRHALRRPATTR